MFTVNAPTGSDTYIVSGGNTLTVHAPTGSARG
jgi:hypothetical protein